MNIDLAKKQKKRNIPQFNDKIDFIRELILSSTDIEIIQKIYLFGSYAYGKPNKNSDIDLCVIIGDDYQRIKIANDIRRRLYNNNIIPVDLLVYNKSEFELLSKRRGIIKTITEKGKLLYGIQ